MSRESLVFIVGLIVLFTPVLGIPSVWKSYILTAAGIALLLLGYFLRRASYYRRIDRGNGERATDSFVETTQKLFEDSDSV